MLATSIPTEVECSWTGKSQRHFRVTGRIQFNHDVDRELLDLFDFMSGPGQLRNTGMPGGHSISAYM